MITILEKQKRVILDKCSSSQLPEGVLMYKADQENEDNFDLYWVFPGICYAHDFQFCRGSLDFPCKRNCYVSYINMNHCDIASYRLTITGNIISFTFCIHN